MPTSVSALILAAGLSARFGGQKLLAPYKGLPLAVHGARTVRAAVNAGLLADVLAVVPTTRLLWRLYAAEKVPHVQNPKATRGISTSIQLGLTTLAAGTSGAALVILADQPLLRLEVIEALVTSWRQTGISVRPRYQAAPDEPGHPVLLDRSLWHLADGLTGDTGLGGILRGQQINVLDVSGSNPDVDTPQDLALL